MNPNYHSTFPLPRKGCLTTLLLFLLLPGAAPAVARAARAAGVRAVPVFAGSYLAVWALSGVVVYAVDRPHGSVAVGVVVKGSTPEEFEKFLADEHKRWDAVREAAGIPLQ